MQITKLVNEYDVIFRFFSTTDLSQGMKELRELTILVDILERKNWMPRTEKVRYPVISDKYLDEYSTIETEKLKTYEESLTLYELPAECKYQAIDFVNNSLLMIKNIASLIIQGNQNSNAVSLYKDLYDKNISFLRSKISPKQFKIVKIYLDFIIDRLTNEGRCKIGNITYGEILTEGGLKSLLIE